MSTPGTGTIQRARLLSAGLRMADLPQLRNVDTASRFAARARELAAALSGAGGVLGKTA